MIKLLRYLRPYWKAVTLALVMLVGMVFTDLTVPRLLQRLVDQGIARHDLAAIVNTALLMVGVSIVGAVLTVGNTVMSVHASQSFGADVRAALYRRIQSLSFGNLDHLHTGKLMVRLVSDVAVVQQVILMSMRVLTRAPLIILGAAVFMVVTSPQLSLIMFTLLILAMLSAWFFASYARPLFNRVQQRLERLNNVMQENLAGVRVVKAFVRAAYEAQRFEQANLVLMQQNTQVVQFTAVLIPIVTTMANLGTVALVWLGGQRVMAGQLSVGQILAFVNYLAAIMFPLVMLGNIANLVSAALASAQRIREILGIVPEVQNRPGARPLVECRGQVAFEDVCFSYNHDCSEPVLDHVNLVAEPGQTMAILGATGSGKSSLVELIPRFYDVTAGRLTVDGIDVRDLTVESLRAHISVALQDTVLFQGSVRDNIAYGRPNATDEEVIAAAKVAEAHDFIIALPRGYQTPVGERGATLSGGQKQRIAIARALLVQPRILILDDSTSSVDVQTEGRIQVNLQSVHGDSTRFVIAQRISSVLHADKIVVLDRGQIVATGTHQELMQTSPVYREIYDSQLGDRGVLHD
jgi:ATP-binding cassette subfamily B multidrug efflux pump